MSKWIVLVVGRQVSFQLLLHSLLRVKTDDIGRLIHSGKNAGGCQITFCLADESAGQIKRAVHKAPCLPGPLW